MPAGAAAIRGKTAGGPAAAPGQGTAAGTRATQAPAAVPAAGARGPAPRAQLPTPPPRAKTPPAGVVPTPAPRGKPATDVGAAWDDLSDGDLVNLSESGFGSGADISGVSVPKRPSPLAGIDERIDLLAPVGPVPTKQTPDLPPPAWPSPLAH